MIFDESDGENHSSYETNSGSDSLDGNSDVFTKADITIIANIKKKIN